MRSAIKNTAERALIWSGIARFHRRRMPPRSLVLAYHNVLPDAEVGSGDLPNHLPLSSFAAQLTALRDTHEVVPLAELLSAQRASNPRPRVAITFDDAYRGAVTCGVAELVRQGMPATIFVAPALLGGKSFWWDALATPAPHGLDPAVRAHALEELCGDDAAVRSWAERDGRPVVDVPPLSCTASEEELLRAASAPGITVGAHSWTHPNLTRLGERALADEMVLPLTWLRARIAAPLPWIAYPYGLHDPAVRRAAADAGYEVGLGISGGWVTRTPPDRFALPRVNVPPGLSLHGFVLRGAGLLDG